MKLTATAHEIEVRRSGYTPQRVTITPRPDFPQAVKVRLRSLQEPKAAGPSRLSVRGHELRLLAPGNAHHAIEASFKAVARALGAAVAPNPRVGGVPSTKGSL